MDTLNTLLDLPRSAVYAIVDEKHKRVLVQYSTSVIASLGRLVEKIRLGEPPCRDLSPIDELKFVVLEEDECRNRLMVRTGFYMREYKNRGYRLLVEKPPVEYRLVSFPLIHPGPNGRVTLQAFLVSKRRNRILVGEFKTQDEYDAFKALNYSIEPSIDLIYDKSIRIIE